VLYMWLSVHACRGSGCSLPHSALSKVSKTGTVSLNKKVAPNKATSNLNWENGKYGHL